MGLTQATVEMLRRAAREASELPVDGRLTVNAHARVALAVLRLSLTEEEAPDEVLATVCLVIAQSILQLGGMNMHDLAEVLDVTPSAYTLAAAHLARLYDATDDGAAEAAPPSPKETAWGGYL